MDETVFVKRVQFLSITDASVAYSIAEGICDRSMLDGLTLILEGPEGVIGQTLLEMHYQGISAIVSDL